MSLKHSGVSRIGYVWIAVDDPRLLRARAFYVGELGLMETASEPDRAMFRCWHDPYQFSLIVEHSAKPGLVEVGFQVRDANDLEGLGARAVAAGVGLESASAPAGLGQSIAFVVPAGPRLRLFDEMQQPGYVTGFESPDWVVPKALRGTPAPLHLNHVAFTSPEPARCSAFLTDVLDFFVSEKVVGSDGTLVSAMLYRMLKNVGGQELTVFPAAAPSDSVRLHHIAFSKEDSSDILADGTHLRSDGIEIDLLGPVRQPYGSTFSLYFRDPFGVRIELCSGGRMTEPHRDYQPVQWSAENFKRALSYYDESIGEGFLEPSL